MVTFNQIVQVIEYNKLVSIPLLSFEHFTTQETKVSCGNSMFPVKRTHNSRQLEYSQTTDRSRRNPTRSTSLVRLTTLSYHGKAAMKLIK